MGNILSCPECVKVVRFRQDQIGKKVICPRCITPFRLAQGPRDGAAVLCRITAPAGRSAPATRVTRRKSIPAPADRPAPARADRPAPAPPSQAPSKKSFAVWPLVLVLALALFVGGGLAGYLLSPRSASPAKKSPGGYASDYNYGADGEIRFKDDVQSQTRPSTTALDLNLVDAQGKHLDLKQYHGKKNVVLVVMRGFDGNVCLGCRAQTSRLISWHAEFVKRDAEVLVVYPGERRHVKEFIWKARQDAANVPPPFPVVLDEDLRLVDRFDIRDQLAKPATYILDKQGRVRFTYVGTDRADRPSVKAMLKQLDALSVQ